MLRRASPSPTAENMSKHSFALVAVVLAALAPAGVSGQQCPGGNLLRNARVVQAIGDGSTAYVHDGRAFPEGTAWDVPETMRRAGAGAMVVFDLGAPTRIRSALLQGDSNDIFALSTSLDGTQFEGVWAAPAIEEPPFGLRFRVAAPFDVVTRFVRIDVLSGDGLSSVSEVQAFCAASPPVPAPFSIVTAYRADPSALLYRSAITTKAVVCLAAIAALALLTRLRNRRVEIAAFVAFTLWSCFAFTDLGYFHGHGHVVHPTDSFHYFTGPKYFEELGYFDMYDCLAKAERENGHTEALRGYYIRNLRSNELRPLSLDGSTDRCPTSFTPARWRSFRRDLEASRPLFPASVPTQRMLADHGYNGTPITTAFHRMFVHGLSLTPTHMLGMTLLDSLSNLLAVLLIGYALGPVAGILAGLVISSGEPWGYQWVGGSIGRANFVVWLAMGMALAARGKEALSAAALTMAALFRLFPAVFVGAVGLRAIVKALRGRRLEKNERNIVLAALGTLVVGVLVAGFSVGFDAFGDWYLVMKRHAQNPPGNHLGLPLILNYQPGVDSGSLIDGRLSNPLEVWEMRLHEIRTERLSLHILGVVFAFGVLLTAIRRGATQLESIGFGGILLFSLLAITNYDGVWLIALVPLVYRSLPRIAALLAFLASTQFLALVYGALEPRCLAESVLMYALLVYVSLDALREISARPISDVSSMEAPENSPTLVPSAEPASM